MFTNFFIIIIIIITTIIIIFITIITNFSPSLDRNYHIREYEAKTPEGGDGGGG
jgi:hypothetical protein